MHIAVNRKVRTSGPELCGDIFFRFRTLIVLGVTTEERAVLGGRGLLKNNWPLTPQKHSRETAALREEAQTSQMIYGCRASAGGTDVDFSQRDVRREFVFVSPPRRRRPVFSQGLIARQRLSEVNVFRMLLPSRGFMSSGP